MGIYPVEAARIIDRFKRISRQVECSAKETMTELLLKYVGRTGVITVFNEQCCTEYNAVIACSD